MTLLIFQVTIILSVSLTCGWIARRLGQARVIGEIIGGILIGPSVLGRFVPHAFSKLFPATSISLFETISTLGLILFLFLIGSELNYEHIREQRFTATITSLTSMLFPFALGVLASPLLLRHFAPADVAALPFFLFLGISMSITAFPVLARILEERQMQSIHLGATAMMCAAVDDVTAWSLLAVAMALLPTDNTTIRLSYRVLWLGAYLCVMMFVVRPLGAWLARRNNEIRLSYELLGIMLVTVFLSAAATDAIGVHPLFGAFLAGLCFPRVRRWQETLRSRLDVVVSLLLLPIFFALTGMKTRLDLLSGLNIWLWTGFVLFIAVIGKMGGAIAAARWTGYDWKNSIALGALLNTRGLVELIVLNIAYNAHVFSPTLFTMLVLMALATTMMTTPILNALKIGVRADAPDLSFPKAA